MSRPRVAPLSSCFSCFFPSIFFSGPKVQPLQLACRFTCNLSFDARKSASSLSGSSFVLRGGGNVGIEPAA